MSASLLRVAREPLDDYLAAIDRLRDGRMSLVSAFAWLLLALVVTWFVYVPLHELLHAWGCLATGGSVSRLDIAPEYGGVWLSTIFPYVRSGSEYAGQLSGFDTHGSDVTYLATVLAPYLLTVLIGVPLLKWVGNGARGHGGDDSGDGTGTRDRTDCVSTPALPILLGIAVILAYAPIISLNGDYYEAGSISMSRAAHLVDASIPLARWRSDDLPKLVSSLHASGATVGDWLGIAGSFIAGIVLAWLTYRLGGIVYSLLRWFCAAMAAISDSSSRHSNS